MGVLENIKQWWKSTAPKEEAFDYVMPPPSKEEKEELRAMKESLRALTRSLFSFLGDETAEKLAKRVSAAFKFEDDKTSSFACALRDGLYGDYFIKNRRPPYLLLFEARYVEDVIPMVGSVCRSYQIDATDFVFDEQNESLEPVYFFGRFNSWITQKQFETVIFDSCGDEYCCFLVPANSLDSVLKQLQTLGIEAYNIPGQM